MGDRTEFLKLNTSITTGSNAEQIETDSVGNKKASIELRLPDSLSRKEGLKKIDLQASQMRLSLSNLPIAFIPVDPRTARIEYEAKQPITSKLWIGFWKPYVNDGGGVSTDNYIPYSVMKSKTVYSACTYLKIPLTFEPIDMNFIERTGLIPVTRIDTLTFALENTLKEQIRTISGYGSVGPSGQEPYNIVDIDLSLNSDNVTLKITQVPGYYGTTNATATALQPMGNGVFLYGTPGILSKNEVFPNKTHGGSFGYITSGGTSNPNISPTPSYFVAPTIDTTTGYHWGCMLGYNIICNKPMKDLLNFLPWLSPVNTTSLTVANYIPEVEGTAYSGEFYVLDSVAAKCEVARNTTNYRRDWHIYPPAPSSTAEQTRAVGLQGTDVTYRWENIPTILLSPVSSVVLLMDGLGVSPQILPINIRQRQGSSLTTTIPVVENYFPLTSTLRDLHDDLILRKENFANTALFSIPPSGITERTLRFRIGYITKDGQLFDLYIPPTGVFTLQLTFCFHY